MHITIAGNRIAKSHRLLPTVAAGVSRQGARVSDMSIIIRQARLEDADRVHELHGASVCALCRSHYSPEVIEAWLANRCPTGYHDPIRKGALFVADRGGRIVGFGEAVRGEVLAVFVDPEETSQGIGTTILSHAVSLAKQGHSGPVRLEATLNAVDFYAQAGFHTVRHSVVERNHVHIPVEVMESNAG